jgi:hypothetical protein
MSLRPIRRLSMTRALPGAVLLLTLTLGCANTPMGTGGSGQEGMDPGQPAATDPKAASVEAGQVAEHVWAVASGVHDVGSRLVFTFWSERGALTMTGYEAVQRGGRRGKPVNANSTQRAVVLALATAMQGNTGELQLTLRRGDTSWEVEPNASFHTVRPTEARTAPGRQGVFVLGQSTTVSAGLQQLLKSVEVPADGTVWVDLNVRLRNGRVVDWKLEQWRPIRAGRGGKPRPVSAQVASEAANVVVLYAPGMGSRTVHLGLRLSHRDNEQAASGWVEETRVERPLSTDGDRGLATPTE